jgi:hypothetical protein
VFFVKNHPTLLLLLLVNGFSIRKSGKEDNGSSSRLLCRVSKARFSHGFLEIFPKRSRKLGSHNFMFFYTSVYTIAIATAAAVSFSFFFVLVEITWEIGG